MTSFHVQFDSLRSIMVWLGRLRLAGLHVDSPEVRLSLNCHFTFVCVLLVNSSVCSVPIRRCCEHSPKVIVIFRGHFDVHQLWTTLNPVERWRKISNLAHPYEMSNKINYIIAAERPSDGDFMCSIWSLRPTMKRPNESNGDEDDGNGDATDDEMEWRRSRLWRRATTIRNECYMRIRTDFSSLLNEQN